MIEPTAAVALAIKLSDVVGLSDWLKNQFGDSPTAQVAKKIVDTAVKVSGAKNTADVVQILNADPAKAAQVAEALRADEAELVRLAFADMKDARAMQVAALNQTDVFSKRFVYLFIAAWSLFSMGYIVLVTMATLPPNNVRYADMILGFLFGTAMGSSFQYLLGTTVGNKLKDLTISTLTKNAV
jgi:hypothetical protein